MSSRYESRCKARQGAPRLRQHRQSHLARMPSVAGRPHPCRLGCGLLHAVQLRLQLCLLPGRHPVHKPRLFLHGLQEHKSTPRAILSCIYRAHQCAQPQVTATACAALWSAAELHLAAMHHAICAPQLAFCLSLPHLGVHQVPGQRWQCQAARKAGCIPPCRHMSDNVSLPAMLWTALDTSLLIAHMCTATAGASMVAAAPVVLSS